MYSINSVTESGTSYEYTLLEMIEMHDEFNIRRANKLYRYAFMPLSKGYEWTNVLKKRTHISMTSMDLDHINEGAKLTMNTSHNLMCC